MHLHQPARQLVLVLDLEIQDGVALDQIVVHTKVGLFELAGWLEMLQVYMAFAEALVEADISIHDLDPKLPAFGRVRTFGGTAKEQTKEVRIHAAGIRGWTDLIDSR